MRLQMPVGMNMLSDLAWQYQNSKALDAHKELSKKLDKIGKKASRNLNGREKEFWRRLFIQTLYAMIEAEITILKCSALQEWYDKGQGLSPGDLHYLKAREFKLADNGQVKTSKIKSKIIPELKFAIRTFSKTHELRFEADYNDQKWLKIFEFIEIRNRIVHPKTIADLEISDADIGTSLDAWEWFMKCVVEQQKEINQKLKARVETIKKHARLIRKARRITSGSN